MKAAIKSCVWCSFVFLFATSCIYPTSAAQLVSVPGIQSKLGGSGDSGLSIISQDGPLCFVCEHCQQSDTGRTIISPCCRPGSMCFCATILTAQPHWSAQIRPEPVVAMATPFQRGISTNGRFALFESSASDLVANDTNNTSDIFVRDVVNGTTRLVSIGNAGGNASGASRGSVLTPDGRYVAFVSAAPIWCPVTPTASLIFLCGIYQRARRPWSAWVRVPMPIR